MSEHMGFILAQAPLGEVIALCPVVFIDALGVTKRQVELPYNSHMKGSRSRAAI
jgi:hypothetical protein